MTLSPGAAHYLRHRSFAAEDRIPGLSEVEVMGRSGEIRQRESDRLRHLFLLADSARE